MKTMIQAAAVTLFAASAAHAQQAVQWKVSDGGNGHWYQLRITGPLTWGHARLYCEALGGYLATPTSPQENSLLVGLAADPAAWVTDCCGNTGGPWLGGYQPVGANPDSPWRWVTGEPWGWTGWAAGEPNNGFQPGVLVTVMLGYPPVATNYRGWADGYAAGSSPSDPVQYPLVPSCLIEWSADCNGDGIVDYGQCRDGSLPDYDGDNIPDCCESGTACVVGNYPVQWRVADGGNGHWYRALVKPQAVSWVDAKTLAVSLGGHLATLTTASENDWVFDRCARGSGGWECGGDCYGPWLGGFQDSSAVDYEEPAGGWRWVTGEPWSFTAWAPSLPNNAGEQNWLHFYGSPKLDGPFTPGPRWDDVEVDWFMIRSLVIEWSADCNGDGTVDYGQILQGQLADANADGIPDICQPPTCVDADLFRDFNVDGADLGILLAQWGPSTPLTVSDINDDGIVDGADLGLLLSFWGACP